jgi:hypothetical protein
MLMFANYLVWAVAQACNPSWWWGQGVGRWRLGGLRFEAHLGKKFARPAYTGKHK